MNSEEDLDILVENVREQVLEQITTVKPKTDFEFLVKFVRAKKYNTEAAVVAICKYYKSIDLRFELFRGVRTGDLDAVFNSGTIRVLKGSVDKVTVFSLSFHNWNPYEVHLQQLMLAYAFLIEESLKSLNFQVHGVMGILDCSGLSFKHVMALGYSQVKVALKLVLDTYPVRIVAVHHLNPPILFWPIYKIASKFFPAKIRERIKFHGDEQGLMEFVPPEILPKSLGGNLEEEEAWNASLFSNLVQRNPSYEDYWRGEPTE